MQPQEQDSGLEGYVVQGLGFRVRDYVYYQEPSGMILVHYSALYSTIDFALKTDLAPAREVRRNPA